MLRSLPRAATSSSLFFRPAFPSRLVQPVTTCLYNSQPQQKRSASGHAISNPTLAGIEKRWEAMAPQEQADLWMSLRDRMKADWHQLTVQEKKAAYWIAFGPHGPRALPPPGQGKTVALYTFIGIAASFIILLLIRTQSRPPPATMTKEYQESSNEYLKAQNSEPISGISSEGYVGKGMVQSPPKKKD